MAKSILEYLENSSRVLRMDCKTNSLETPSQGITLKRCWLSKPSSSSQIIADNVAKMVANICRLYHDTNEAEEIGVKARKLIEDIYDKNKVINRLLIFYNELTTKREITVLN